MARKKKQDTAGAAVPAMDENTHIPGAGIIENKFITETLETNYMPYAMRPWWPGGMKPTGRNTAGACWLLCGPA